MANVTADTQAAVDLLQKYAKRALGKTIKVTSSLRSCDQQNGLYAKGRTQPGTIITNARGCLSWHVLGRAVDISIPSGTDAEYRELGAYWKSIGGGWGGDFTGFYDPVHFEWHPGTSIEEVCPNPDHCQDGLQRSYGMASVFPTPGSGFFTPIAIAGAMFGGYLLWSRRR
jgi:hypothetical protein